jgi:sporulation protein YlmC with PRC-barrel domain
MRTSFARAVLIASCCFCGSALAQQGSSGSSAPIAGGVQLGTSTQQLDLIAEGWRASKLLHAPVYNEQNQRIGRIDDMIVAPDGTLSVAVIDVGGFLGVGRHHVAIPMDQFSQLSPRIVLPGATKQALKDVPQFAYAKQSRR